MGLLENAYQVRGLARYLVASENLGWSAFAYERYREAVGAQTSPQVFASIVAERYAQRVSDYGNPYTIAALDLGQLDTVVTATDTLAGELLHYALVNQANRDTLISLRAQAQKVDSSGNLTITNDDEYVDLDHWTSLVQTDINDDAVGTAATTLRAALDTFILWESHASGAYLGTPINLDNARGIGIYFPPRLGVATYQRYTRGDLTFPTDTRWDEFLAAGLAALAIDPSLPEPNPVPPLPWGYQVYLPSVRR